MTEIFNVKTGAVVKVESFIGLSHHFGFCPDCDRPTVALTLYEEPAYTRPSKCRFDSYDRGGVVKRHYFCSNCWTKCPIIKAKVSIKQSS